MADFTKKAIEASFLKLLEQKPLKQITVRDIVEDCGINRNTFYYHFQDIPQLLEYIVSRQAARLVTEHPDYDSLEQCMDQIISFALYNKAAVMHIYKSVNRDVFETYQWRVCSSVMTRYVDGLIRDRRISPQDREMIITYVTGVGFGLVMGWLESGMDDKIVAFNHRMCALKRGDLDTLIDRCAASAD